MPKFSSIADLMEADEKGELGDDDFDDELWLLLLQHIDMPSDLAKFDQVVSVYFASRYMEWEVGNGGFAQAAYNIPEWFDPAASAYRQLGLETAAMLIQEAASIMRKGEARGRKFNARAIGKLFQQFRESKLAKLDNRLDDVGWWADEQRLRYVRKNRAAFKVVG